MRERGSGAWTAVNGHVEDAARDVLIHDIRNPLAAIRGYTQLLRRRAASNDLNIAALTGSLQQIEAAASRVQGLLDQLGALPSLNHARTDELHREPTLPESLHSVILT